MKRPQSIQRLVGIISYRMNQAHDSYHKFLKQKDLLDDLTKENLEFNATKLYAVIDSVRYLSKAAEKYFDVYNLVAKSSSVIIDDLLKTIDENKKPLDSLKDIASKSSEHPAIAAGNASLSRTKKCIAFKNELIGYVELAKEMYNVMADTSKESENINSYFNKLKTFYDVPVNGSIKPSNAFKDDEIEKEFILEPQIRIISNIEMIIAENERKAKKIEIVVKDN